MPNEKLTLEDIDKAFSMAWKELFRQKKEILELIDKREAENNELLKIIIKKIERLEYGKV